MTDSMRLFALIICFTAIWQPLLAAEVYRWIDDDGVIHYGSQRPTEKAADKLRLQRAPTAPEAEPEQELTPAEASCVRAQASLEELQSDRPIAYEDEAGNLTPISEEQRTFEAERARRFLNENCAS